MAIEVTNDPHRRPNKCCRNCHEPAKRWLSVGDDNLRVVVALCIKCAMRVGAELLYFPEEEETP